MPVPRAVTLVRSPSLSGVAEYAYAATAPAEARLIFLAGACPLNQDGSTAAVGDFSGQVAKAVDSATGSVWVRVGRIRLSGAAWCSPG